MKLLIAWVVLCVCACGPFGFGQENRSEPTPVSIIELIANGEKFNGKMIMVRGFLHIGQEPHHGVESYLYLHEEDAKNMLDNGLYVIPSEQMIKDQEKLDRRYVLLTGRIAIVRAANAPPGVMIKGVENCVPWSDPTRPIGDSPKMRKERRQ